MDRNNIKLLLWGQKSWSQNATTQVASSLSDQIGSTKGPLSSICRRGFLETCWDFRLTDAEWSKADKTFDSYFSRYEEFCRVNRPHVLATCSHEELCRSARELSTGTRKDVEDNLANSISAPPHIPRDDRSVVAFIGKAILRLDLTNWVENETLRNYITRTLGVVSRQTDRDRLPPTLNAATFNEKAGIRILWQPDLASHLDITFGDTTLKMFHDVALLDLLEKGPFKNLFPSRFIEETRRTIDLMLPKSEPHCRDWLEKELRSTKLGVSVVDRAYQGIVDRNLQTFDFWRDRLIVAKDVFDTSQPRGLRQLLRDDRNRVAFRLTKRIIRHRSHLGLDQDNRKFVIDGRKFSKAISIYEAGDNTPSQGEVANDARVEKSRLGLPCNYVVPTNHSLSRPSSELSILQPTFKPTRSSDDRQSRMLDLRLLHHYVTAACKTFPFTEDGETSRFWTVSVPSMAFEHEVLLDALLGATAFHLSACHPNDRSLAHTGYIFYGRAVNEQRQALSIIDASTADPLCVASIFIMLTTFKIHCRNSICMTYSPPILWFRIVKGMGVLIRHSESLLRHDGIRVVTEKMPDLVENANDAARLNTLPQLPDLGELLTSEDADFSVNLSEDARQSRRRFGNTLYRIYSSAVAGFSKHWIRYQLFSLAATNEEEILDLIEREDQLTIVALSHYFALVEWSGSNWWLQSELDAELQRLFSSIAQPLQWALPIRSDGACHARTKDPQLITTLGNHDRMEVQ